MSSKTASKLMCDKHESANKSIVCDYNKQVSALDVKSA